MAQNIAKRKPLEGINTDAAAQNLKETEARFLLNVERNGRKAQGLLTPVEANRVVPLLGLPADATTLSSFESKRTKEIYSFVYAPGGAHTIYRINADLSTHIIYQGKYPGLSAEPQHSIRGCYLFEAQGRKYLVWVDGLNWQGFLDVEASRLTNSFKVPYFQRGEYDPYQYVQLPTRPPMHCVRGEWIYPDLNDEDELSKQNHLLDATWQFRIKYIYTDGRESAWSPISSAFYVERTADQKNARGLPRSLRLRFSAGHPQVEKIVLAFRNCNGNAYAETNPHDWMQYDIIEKYDDCDEDTLFWQRQIREQGEDFSYDEEYHEFEYIFSGDKECSPIDVAETNRSYNPVPITSYALAPLENRLALFNNVVGYDPIDCEQVKKIEFFLSEPEVSDCKIETVDVQFAILLHNLHEQNNQLIYTFGDNQAGEVKYFGGLGNYTFWATPFDEPGPYLQNFYEKQAGFVAYVEGSDFFCITEQYRCPKPHTTAFDAYEKVGPHGGFASKDLRRQISKVIDDGPYWVQFGTLKVPKGTKGFIRLASHRHAPNGDYQDSSTTLMGITSLSGYYAQKTINSYNTDYYARELEFDTCNGAVDLRERAFLVLDLSGPTKDVNLQPYAATALIGYLRDSNEGPVAGATVANYGPSMGPGKYTSRITDHNGFYFSSWAERNNVPQLDYIGVRFYVEGPDCAKVLGAQMDYLKGEMPNTTGERDVVVDSVENYESDYYVSVSLRFVDCMNVPLPGVRIALRGTKAQTSNNSGIATLRVRNRMFQFDSGRGFSDRIYVMQASAPYLLCTETDECISCLPDYSFDFPHCFSGTSGPLAYDVTAGSSNVVVRLNATSGVYRGLKTGGRYGLVPVFHDAAGRHTFIPQEVTYLTMPTVQQKNAFQFSTLNWRTAGGITLPSWVRYMTFYRTSNLNFNFYVQWIVDDVTFVDSNGGEVPAGAASKIHLTIQSLVDFGSQSGFTVNNAYQYVSGDRIQLLADEAGALFAASDGVLDFLIEGALSEKATNPDRSVYKLIIPYDNRLEDLKEGTLIQITRADACDTEQIFYELCGTVEVENGVPVDDGGILYTFDTYHIRQGVKTIERVFTPVFPFEHHSPSYFWGDHCDDRGRINVKNIWEKQLHYGRTAYVSDALLENGNRNGLSTFRETQVKYFKNEQRGDITYVYGYHRVIKVLCEHGSFTAMVGDDFVRAGRDGRLQAAQADEFMVEANGGASPYGLAYEDTGAVFFESGWGIWLDRAGSAVVFDNGQNVTDISQGKISAYLTAKIVHMNSFNKGKTGLQKTRWKMGYDPVHEKALLTFTDCTNFTNNRQDFDTAAPETFGIYMEDHSIFMQSFTPESYGVLIGSDSGPLFFCFKKGAPWVHGDSGRFNEFFGTACDQVIKLVLHHKGKTILPISLQIESLARYYAAKITALLTDTNSGKSITMQSRIPPICVYLSENRWNASFLFNENTPGVDMPLYNGEALRGTYQEITLLRDHTLNNSLLVHDNQKRIAYSELDSIYFLYAYSEQSAYNQVRE